VAEYPFTEAGVTAALDALGDTSEAIAASLQRLGIHGHRGMCGSCPLAVYLIEQYPEAEVDVNRERIVLGRDVMSLVDGYPVVDHELVVVDTSDPCSDFIGDYDDMDHLRYRFLERTTP